MRPLSFALTGCILLAGCNGADSAGTADKGSAPVAVAAMPGSKPVLLKASDGKQVHGAWYEAKQPKAIVLLFHQGDSSKGEYAQIAPKLVAAGYDALAIDQRQGGDLFGRNENATLPKGEQGFRASQADLDGALAWARAKKLPIILWGSRYSAALIFKVAQEQPDGVKALLAFSPSELIGGQGTVRTAASKLKVPALLVSNTSYEEIIEADEIKFVMEGVPDVARHNSEGLVSGSPMMLTEKNPAGAEANWKAVTAFLDKVTG